MQRKSTICLDEPLLNRKLLSRTETFFDNIHIDNQLKEKFPQLSIQDTKQSVRQQLHQLQNEIHQEIKKSTSNKYFYYIRNYKYFKDRVLKPSSSTSLLDFDNEMSSGAQKILQEAQKNQEVYKEIQGIKAALIGKRTSNKIEPRLKDKIVGEVNQHIMRQKKIDQIMHKRYDGSSGNQLFGASLTKGEPKDLDDMAYEHSQQQLSHVVFKDKNFRGINPQESDSEEEQVDDYTQDNKITELELDMSQSSASYLQPTRTTVMGKGTMKYPQKQAPKLKFTLQDFTTKHKQIKEILQTVSPKRLNAKGQVVVDFEEPDTQILRFKQVGGKVHLQPSVFKNLTRSPEVHNSSSSFQNSGTYMTRKGSSMMFHSPTKTVDKPVESAMQMFAKHQSNQQQRFSNLMKINPHLIKESEALIKLEQSKNIFLSQRQVIDKTLKDTENYGNVLRKRKQTIPLESFKNQKTLGKRTASETLQNIREKETLYFEMYDYMRQLDMDQQEYMQVIAHQPNQQILDNPDEIADLLIQESKEKLIIPQLSIAQTPQENSHRESKFLAKFIASNQKSSLYHSESTQLPPASRFIKTPMDSDMGTSRNTSVFSSPKYNQSPSVNSGRKDWGSLSRNQLPTKSMTEQNTSSLSNMKKTLSQQQLQAKWQLLEKLNQIRDQNQAEVNRQASMVELKQAVKSIQVVMEDHESDDERQKFQDLKTKIKRDIMLSHAFHKNNKKAKTKTII